MAWIGCLRCEKFRRNFIARTFAFFAPVGPDLHRVLWSNEIVQMHPKHYKTHKNMSLGSIVWIGCLRCEKFRCDFVARTFALIAPVQCNLDWVLCSNEIVPNAPKHYETHQNMSLGSNGMDRVASLRKIPKRLRCMNFCINCTSSARFAPSFLLYRNGPKCSQTLWIAPEDEYMAQ